MLYIILVQGFCPLEIKITQFPGGFRLNFIGLTQLLVNWLFTLRLTNLNTNKKRKFNTTSKNPNRLEANQVAIHNNDKVVDIPTTANNPASPAVMAGFELGETEEIVRPKALDRLLLEKAG